MTKYLYVECENDPDFGKLTFVEQTENRIGLEEIWNQIWSKSNHESDFVIRDPDSSWEETFHLKADSLDEHTMEVMQDLIDYDADKGRGWIKVK